MKYTIAAAVLFTVVSAQSLSDIPECAVPCINDARTSSTNCAADDYACICSNKATLTSAATGCILQACGADVAAGQVLPAVNSFCDAVESGGSSSSGAATSSTATPTSTDTASSTPTEVTSTPITSTVSTPYTTVVTSNSTATSNPSGSSTYNTPTTAPTAGAASVVGSLGMLAFGFAVAL
ncbi:hypothetical protein F4821DRAFT_248122 [Hypoxylon rubiginosum]|uniref:Uncharacterized protein n=1 Tax=Hypoxylon rubiginosum TaxID=110542 RepID=A0ACC0CNT8_9PEZI|nr:hypothetical protein F4821DRAFT_248122 [Hypoxylon rubiginosum]